MRQRQTHTATVYSEIVVDTNTLNTPMTDTTDPIITFPCRLETSREEVDLDETGARIEEEPFAIVPLYGRDPADSDVILETMESVSIGDDLKVTDRWSSREKPYRILGIEMQRGRGNAPRNVHLTLTFYGRDQGIPGENTGGTGGP